MVSMRLAQAVMPCHDRGGDDLFGRIKQTLIYGVLASASPGRG
jgi:hypothetical protein